MNLKKYITKGFIVNGTVDKEEITKLLRLAERDIREATQNCHEIDWQFAIALRASGYRATTKVGHHWVTFTLLPDILGHEFMEVAHYFNNCRAKRNTSEYCEIDTISQAEAEKLIQETNAFKKKIVSWLKKHHPKLLT